MKKILIFLLAAAAVTVSCARETASDNEELEAEALEAYMQKYHSDAVRTSLGAYIFPSDEVPGGGDALSDEKYIRINYTITDRDGHFKSSTLRDVNSANGNYKSGTYYGPVIYYRADGNLPDGLEEMLSGAGTAFGPMKAGGTRKALIPGWLLSGTTAVYTVTLVEAFDETEVWEKDSLARFIQKNYPDAVEDEQLGGWYYLTTRPGEDSEPLSSDSEIYCNYILRDLSGRVIDTNVEKVAKDNGISRSSYTPQLINWNEDYTKITMSGSQNDVVDGFAKAFLHMHKKEAGIVFFWSGLGYPSGNGSSIPAYCPLRFDIELVDKP